MKTLAAPTAAGKVEGGHLDAAACLFAEQLAVGEAGPSAAVITRGGFISDLLLHDREHIGGGAVQSAFMLVSRVPAQQY